MVTTDKTDGKGSTWIRGRTSVVVIISTAERQVRDEGRRPAVETDDGAAAKKGGSAPGTDGRHGDGAVM